MQHSAKFIVTVIGIILGVCGMIFNNAILASASATFVGVGVLIPQGS